MIQQFQKLTSEEQQLLYKAPALVSALVCCSSTEVNKAQKTDAIKLAHLKTFTAPSILHPYYIEVENTFKEQLEAILTEHAPFDAAKQAELKNEINKVHLIMQKLDSYYREVLYKSLQAYAQHVKKAAHSVFQDFMFPMPIPGLSA